MPKARERKPTLPATAASAWRPGFNLYKDSADEWRWFLKAENGHTLADSGEGYKRKVDAIRAIDSIRRLASFPDVHVISAEPSA